MFAVYIIALVFGVVCSIIAFSKGRNSLGWFFAGLLIGPFALMVAALPPVVRAGQFKRCPGCAEIIPEDAVRCRHCQLELQESSYGAK